jgi:hypothetical protein
MVLRHHTPVSPAESFVVPPSQLEPSNVKALPLLSTATQKVVEAQDTEVGSEPDSNDVGLPQLPELNLSPLPFSSTATQKEDDTQDTDSMTAPPSMLVGMLHAEPLKLDALPSLPTAMQKDEVGHDTAVAPSGGSTDVGPIQPLMANAGAAAKASTNSVASPAKASRRRIPALL